jgi:hypothetical protein
MRPVVGKTVYVFGAGASAHAGAPLLGNFLSTSKQLLESTETLQFEESFDSLFKWIGGFKKSAVRLNLNFDNLEDVFSLISMAKEIGDPEFNTLHAQIVNVIFETLDKTVYLQRHHDSSFSPVYNEFVAGLDEMNRSRMSSVRPGKFIRDSVITFNYDVLLDHAFRSRRLRFHYGLGEADGIVGSDSWFCLSKLHGSMNWAIHSDCSSRSNGDSPIQILDIAKLQLSASPDHSNRHRMGMYRELRQEVCSVSGCNTRALMPLFVPPTWTKSPSLAGLSRVWSNAAAELKDAQQLVVIGYSLPTTDTFFQYLLALGLLANESLERVLIVDPMSGDSGFEARFRGIFTHPVKVEFEQVRFESFCSGSFGWKSRVTRLST